MFLYPLEDPYFIDEDILIEREALLTDEDKEVNLSSYANPSPL